MTDINAPVGVVIDLGRYEGETVWRYFVDFVLPDGVRCGMSCCSSHEDALRYAHDLADDDGLPIDDRSAGRLQ